MMIQHKLLEPRTLERIMQPQRKRVHNHDIVSVVVRNGKSLEKIGSQNEHRARERGDKNHGVQHGNV